MKQITFAEFKTAVDLDPAWAASLTEPVEVTGWCYMAESQITHLSPHLHFLGAHQAGNCADFSDCPNLKVAEGTFHGSVKFNESGIERIGRITIIKGNNINTAAEFRGCKALKVAEGTFPGFVSFMQSGVEKIGNLVITHPDKDGYAADFSHCENLRVATGTFPGYVDFADSGVKQADNLKITDDMSEFEADFIRPMNKFKANFTGCNVRLPSELLGPEYAMTEQSRQKNLERIAAKNAMRQNQNLEI